MKLRLLDFLVCPGCAHAFTVAGSHVVRGEILEGNLTCGGCTRTFAIVGGVPQLMLDSTHTDGIKARTSASFGLLWSRTTDATAHGGAHAAKMLTALTLPRPAGLILDAGCGDGSDVAALAAAPGAEVVGVELSQGGTRAAFQRTSALGNAHVVRADLCRLPFRASQFSFVYSYGVVHHLPVPAEAMSELARVSEPGATAAVYLYEDFSERVPWLRWGLRAANTWRSVTTRLPHALLYGMCIVAAPFVYLGFALPYKVFSRVRLCRPLVAGLPFRHGRSPFSLTGDLYDRFSAPVEYRYSRQTAALLANDAGFAVRQVRYERGWMLELKRDPVR